VQSEPQKIFDSPTAIVSMQAGCISFQERAHLSGLGANMSAFQKLSRAIAPLFNRVYQRGFAAAAQPAYMTSTARFWDELEARRLCDGTKGDVII
jgi:hypothetical protein